MQLLQKVAGEMKRNLILAQDAFHSALLPLSWLQFTKQATLGPREVNHVKETDT